MYPTRSFEPCLNFKDEAVLPRTRKVGIDTQYDENLFTIQRKGRSLGSSLGLCRAGQETGELDDDMELLGEEAMVTDIHSITALCDTRIEQRDQLIADLQVDARKEPRRFKT